MGCPSLTPTPLADASSGCSSSGQANAPSCEAQARRLGASPRPTKLPKFVRANCASGKDTIETLARVAGERWKIEQCFETAKGECGLDHYECAPLAGLVSAYHAVHVGPCRVVRVASAGRKKLQTRKCGSAYRSCATYSPQCCGADGTDLSICCIGPSGEDDINSKPCAATIEARFDFYLQL